MLLTLRPATRPGRYVALLGLSDRALCTSRQPFLDAARVLAGEGVDPATELTASHEGSAIVALRSTIGEAAKWAVEESDRGGLRRRPWKPHPGRGGVPETEREAAE